MKKENGQSHAATVLLAKDFLSLSEIRGVLDAARAHHWLLRVPRMLNLKQEIRSWRGDGILTDSGYGLAELRKRGVAIVGTTDLHSGLKQEADVIVSSNDLQIGRMAAEFFLRKGYRNFGCGAVNRRGAAFRAALREHGFESFSVIPGNICDGLRGNPELVQALTVLPRPCGLFCDNDFDAAVVADTARALGLDVPHDLAILGVGNEAFFQNARTPEISSVDSRLYDRAFLAAEQLARILEGTAPRRKNGETPRFFALPPAGIVERHSTDCWAIADDRLGKMVRFLRESAEKPDFKVREIAKKFLLTESTVYRCFTEAFRLSPKEFLLEERLRLARRRLEEGNDTVAVVAEECGFPSAASLYAAFHAHFGISPAVWRRHCRTVR